MYYLNIFIYFCAFSTGFKVADGATCTTVSTCLATDFTLSNCTSNTCNCINSNYTSARSGCALKMDKPIVTPTIFGRSNQVASGQILSLTCKVNGANTYTWFRNGAEILLETSSIYTVNSASGTANSGSHTCQGIAADGVLKSPMSNPFNVEVLGSGTSESKTSSIVPVLYVPTLKVVGNTDIVVDCRNIPMGYSETITYKVGATILSTSTIKVNSGNKLTDATCEISDPASKAYSFITKTSAAVKLPNIITNFEAATVTDANGVSVTEAFGANKVTLTCKLTPDAIYSDPISTIVYAWKKDNSNIPTGTSEKLDATSSGVYTCSVTYATQTTNAAGVKVTIGTLNDNPLLQVTANKPVKGGRVILTCGNARSDGVTYSWTKKGAIIFNQFDRKLQLDNVNTEDSGAYVCTVTKNGLSSDSGSQTITAQDTIEKPTVIVGADIAEGGDYWLTCNTDSETVGMTYEWTVKGKKSSITGKYYYLPSASSNDNGNYVCTAKFKDVTSSASDPVTISVKKPGKICTQDYDCIGTGYSGMCDVSDRCTCNDGYRQMGDDCLYAVTLAKPNLYSNAQTPPMGSTVLLTCNTTDVGVSFSWKTGSQVITGQNSSSYQISSFSKSDVGAYTCSVSKVLTTVTSDPLGVINQAKVMGPTFLFILGCLLTCVTTN